MADEKSGGSSWVQIVLSIIAGLGILFGAYMAIQASAEKQKKIDALNKLAQMDEVRHEQNGSWTKLAQQKDDIIADLRQRNESLANDIDEREERILAMADAVAKIRSARIIIRSQDGDDVHETPEPDGRIRVSFDETQDMIRVSGFTLTNPAEAEINVGFTRPLRLRTVITEEESGAWRAYFESDWDGLEIQEMNTVVNPLSAKPEDWTHNFIFGANVGVAWDFDAFSANAYLMYEFGGSFAIGPSVGVVSQQTIDPVFGINFQLRPF